MEAMEAKEVIPKNEYPRPQFVRRDWQTLNGDWEFSFVEAKFDQIIRVPFAYQWEESGIGLRESHEVIWYRKKFHVPVEWQGKKVILHIGACDYRTELWLNDQLIGEHIGGHSSFSLELQGIKFESENVLVLRVEDYPTDLTLPRGKQYWKEQSEGIFYTPTSGIWQSVWLEPVSPLHIEEVFLTPDINSFSIHMDARLSQKISDLDKDVALKATVEYLGILDENQETEYITSDTYGVQGQQCVRAIHLQNAKENGKTRYWSPGNPRLFSLLLELYKGGECVDRVESYFGMRKISIADGKFCLNDRPYTQRLILDQGYFPTGGLTAPTDEDLKNDILLAKQMGFNGARKHQKVEDPRWLYWADRLGFFVWGEMANAYEYSTKYAERMMHEWPQVLKRDYNHPSIICWVPLNESWGIPNVNVEPIEQAHAQAMYYITKSLDQTRLVMSNDGWEHTKSDLYTMHDYSSEEDILRERYSNMENVLAHYTAGRPMMALGFPYENQPVLVTEFGGISYQAEAGWGYSAATSEEDFLERLRAVFEPLQESEFVQGYCYTQLTDVEQEMNGLLKYNRQPKVALEKIRAIVEKY